MWEKWTSLVWSGPVWYTAAVALAGIALVSMVILLFKAYKDTARFMTEDDENMLT